MATVTRQDGGAPVDPYRYPRTRRLGRSTAVRTLCLVALIVISLLGASYALGHNAGRKGAPSTRTVAASPQAGDGSAEPPVPNRQPSPAVRGAQPGLAAPGAQSSPAERAEGAASAAPNAESGGPAGPARLGPEPGGPFGSRQSTGSPAVALTFDDGPSPDYTPQMLALLRQYRVKATFCLIGSNVQEHPELVRQIVAEGHTICNHSWSHDLMLGGRSPQLIRADLVRTNQAIWAAAPGVPIAYFRQPGGNWTARVVAEASALGMTSVGWAVDPRDWALPGATSVIRTVTANTVAGSIVLMHDGGGNRQGTVAALRSILPNLTRRFTLEALPTGDDPPR